MLVMELTYFFLMTDRITAFSSFQREKDSSSLWVTVHSLLTPPGIMTGEVVMRHKIMYHSWKVD